MVKFVKENILDSWKPFFAENHELVCAIEKALAPVGPKDICPPAEKIFKAFEVTCLKDISVVLLGQDPYHNGQACGLAFSVSPGQSMARSLININRELQLSEGIDNTLANGDLSPWAKHVLLLNASLTTVRGMPNAHQKLWKEFTMRIIRYISANSHFFVFLSWGRFAHQFIPLIDPRHGIIKTSHPSPLGARKSGADYAAFLGSGCFGAANDLLISRGLKSIDWSLPPSA